MQQASDLPDVIVSDAGAIIPAETLRAAGIQPGDHLSFVRTSRGSLVIIPAVPSTDGPSLHSVIGIAPRPAGMGSEQDQAFLRDIRSGNER